MDTIPEAASSTAKITNSVPTINKSSMTNRLVKSGSASSAGSGTSSPVKPRSLVQSTVVPVRHATEQLITLDIGGKVNYTTYKSTLMGCSYFKAMIEFKTDLTNPIFIDCEPESFEHILEYLRFADYKIPLKYKHLGSYFGIEDDAFEADIESQSKRSWNMMYEGKLVSVNLQSDIYLTIEEALDMLSNIRKNYMSIRPKLRNGFALMSNIISSPYIRNLVEYDRRTFIRETLMLMHVTYGSIKIPGKNVLRFKICDTSQSRRGGSYHYSITHQLYISYDIWYYKWVRAFFQSLSNPAFSNITIRKEMIDYIDFFMKYLQSSPKYNNSKGEMACYLPKQKI